MNNNNNNKTKRSKKGEPKYPTILTIRSTDEIANIVYYISEVENKSICDILRYLVTNSNKYKKYRREFNKLIKESSN